MPEIEGTIRRTNGLHVRFAASLIAKLQSLLQDMNMLKRTYVIYKGRKTQVTSLLSIISLKIRRGERIILSFEDAIEPAVLAEIKSFLESEDGHDTADQSQTDQWLMENSMTIEALLASLPNGIIVVNKENVISYANEEAARLFALPVDQLLNKRADQVIPHSRLHIVLETGKSEFAKRQQVDNRIIVTSRSPVLLDGKVVGAVALFQDISKLEQLSQELQEVKELKKQLDLVLHSVDDLIALSDRTGKILYANHGMSQLQKQAGDLASVQAIMGAALWEACSTGDTQHSHLVHVQQTPYICKCNPIIVDRQFCGAVLTMSPFHNVKSLLSQLEIAEERNKYLEQELSKLEPLNEAFASIVGYSETLLHSLAIANKAAKTNSTVLITGESGTGKELVAKAIHQASERRDKPFIRVNCAAIPSSLIESELFGYEKGAFTGAIRTHRGKFELAHTGTIFLDEIGDLGLDVQAKILRALQEREVERIGSYETIKLDVRVIAATHRDLRKMVEEELFREDLYYRLNVIPVHLPPLRNRKEDIPLLADFFRVEYNQRLGKNIKSYESDFLDKLMQYDWPGNIREFQNIIERVISLSDSEILLAKDLPEYIGSMPPRKREAPEDFILLREGEVLPYEEYERRILAHAIQYYPSFNAAGKALGMTHKTVASKVRKFGLEPLLGKKSPRA